MYSFNPPNYKNRIPEEIVNDKKDFESVGFIYRSLSWLDIAKREKNINALHYAAFECRRGIEQLFYEELVLIVGSKLDEEKYKKCKDNPTKLHKIINRLSPDYRLLAEFSKAIISLEPSAPPIHSLDHNKLMKYWGKVSSYLHWAGKPNETFNSEEWYKKGLEIIEEATMYIWGKKTTSFTCIMKIDGMEPEIFDAWSKFQKGEIDIDGVIRYAKLAQPILRERRKRKIIQ